MPLHAVVCKWIVLILVVCLAATGGKSSLATAESGGSKHRAPGEERITADGLRRQLTFLASPEFEGRESGSRGGRAAARYLSLQFTEAGLEPIGPAYLELDAAAPSFFQRFEIIKYHWDAPNTTVRLRRGEPAETVRTYKMPVDFIPWEFSGDIEASASVVFAGYGISAPELGYDDYEGLDARGKVVLVFAHEPEEMQEDSRWGGRAHTREATVESKARNAQTHGAAALLVMPEPLLEHHSLWTLAGRWYQSFAETQQQAIEEPAVRIPILYVKPHVGGELFRAAKRDPEETQRKIDSGGRPLTFSVPGVTLTVNLSSRDARTDITASVIGLWEGSDPELKDEVVIVGAHYDHDGAINGRVFLGADDDGSGTVSVLEMARAMSAAGERPRRSVLFAAWGAEEKGLFGSEVYASRPLRPLRQTAAVINLDMVGRNEAPIHADQRARFGDRDTRNSVNLLGTAFSPELRTLVGKLNEGLNLDLDYKFDRDIEQSLITRSDQWPFAIRSVPTLFFSTGLHPDYHRPADSATKINYEKMERIARLAYRAVWAIADADERPEFSPIPVPADQPGKASPSSSR